MEQKNPDQGLYEEVCQLINKNRLYFLSELHEGTADHSSSSTTVLGGPNSYTVNPKRSVRNTFTRTAINV